MFDRSLWAFSHYEPSLPSALDETLRYTGLDALLILLQKIFNKILQIIHLIFLKYFG